MEQNSFQQNLIGSVVREMRKSKKLRQNDLVAKCQIEGWMITRGTLAKIESGLRRVNDAELYLLSKVLKCSMEDLFNQNVPTTNVLIVARHGRD